MKPIVYIDGKEGTTGLQIYQRLGCRTDIELLLIDEEKRKDVAARKACLNQADIVFLCLPDGAAVEAVSLVENPKTRIIDASTAHRTNSNWVYGFPELAGQREKIATAHRVANPGCHAIGFISAVAPLVSMGILPPSASLSCFSLTGYSGGGKSMISQYESATKDELLCAPALYGLTQKHKHLPEMQAICDLTQPPVFVPIVDDYYKGMATTVSFHTKELKSVSALQDVQEKLAGYYGDNGLVSVKMVADNGKIFSGSQAGRDDLQLILAGNDRQFTITALFDNLGKGASGSAVQNMNIMLGFDQQAGLTIG